MASRTVLALGGNAILPAKGPATIEEQFRVTEATMAQVLALLRGGEQVILTHGNGPIVGNILIRNEAAADTIPPVPLYICGADSQGGIGLMLQQALHNVSNREGIDTHTVTVVTQTVVDPNDPAFKNPTKPIGPFYSEAEARRMEKERGWTLREDAGRGWRRVVASPEPVRIVELETIRTLVGIGQVVIAAGGGGIPVAQTPSGEYYGVEAVIDKDLAAVVLAEAVKADRLVIVTVVDRVALEADGFDFNINLIVGGQIAGLAPEVHLIYPQGNSIHATRDCPFLQIGETKYGKPILDRGFNYETSLSDAVKFGIISIDATMKSNVAVGPPIDLLCYETDSLLANSRMRFDQDDPYLQEIGRKWQNGIIKLVKEMPAPDFTKPSLGFATAA